MAEITRGLRAVLNHPAVYQLFQNLVGATKLRRVLTREFIRPEAGMRVLDIGCGPADILQLFPPLDYLGFDLNPDYIETARRRFGDRGRFYAERFDENTKVAEEGFDRVLAVGFLHHLDDEPARHFFGLARKVLKPGGQVLTIDPALEDGQSWFARALIKRDRGQNVRPLAGYRALAEGLFARVEATCRHDLLNIPYTHAILRCSA